MMKEYRKTLKSDWVKILRHLADSFNTIVASILLATYVPELISIFTIVCIYYGQFET